MKALFTLLILISISLGEVQTWNFSGQDESYKVRIEAKVEGGKASAEITLSDSARLAFLEGEGGFDSGNFEMDFVSENGSSGKASISIDDGKYVLTFSELNIEEPRNARLFRTYNLKKQ